MTPEQLCPLIDADVLLYRCGFATKDHEPVENCLHSGKLMVEAILAKFPQRNWHKLYLSGGKNYRDDIATMYVYKGNRDPNKKPKYYKDLKEYFIQFWDAEVTDGIEADDAMGIEQWANTDKSTVICTIDKDLDMIPGWHYNFVKDNLYYVTIEEANKFFLYQMLVGDKAVDNIPGIDGIGPKKAAKLLDGKTLVECVDVVEGEYKRQYKDAWPEAIKEVANLLWIQRKPNELNPYWK
jgi:5'-3' exonuclease